MLYDLNNLRKVYEEAKKRRRTGQPTLLFIDEIHRFNRAQQDGLLAQVEDGTVLLIGATTENPSFALTGALMSRCQVLVLNRLGPGVVAEPLAEVRDQEFTSARAFLDEFRRRAFVSRAAERAALRYAEVGAFRSSLFAPAAAVGIAVNHATLHYRTPAGEAPAHLSVAWWGDTEFAPHLFDLLRLPGFDARVTFGGEAVQHADRKVLAQRLQERVAAEFCPLTDAQSAALGPEALAANT